MTVQEQAQYHKQPLCRRQYDLIRRSSCIGFMLCLPALSVPVLSIPVALANNATTAAAISTPAIHTSAVNHAAATTTATATANESNNLASMASLFIPYEASYSIRSSAIPFEGKITHTLEKKPNGEWEAHTKAKAFMSSVEEHSRFSAPSCDVKSQEFQYKRTVMGKKKSWSHTFDWPQNRILYSMQASGDTTEQPITIETPSMADRLSEQFSVRCHVSRGETDFTVYSVHHDQVKTQHYRMVGEEELTTPIGTLSTLKVIKVHENPERETTIWFAPAYNYLMVQLVQQDDEMIKVSIKSLP